MGSQVPIMLASPSMEAMSQLLSLKKSRNMVSYHWSQILIILWIKYLRDLCWEFGQVVGSIQLATQVPSLTSTKCCHVGHPCHSWDLGLGTPCELVSPNFHALNGSDCRDWPQVTWDLGLGTPCERALRFGGYQNGFVHSKFQKFLHTCT